MPEEVTEMILKFKKVCHQIYIAGGAVRDILMGKQVSDWDFTTDAKPEEILKILPEGFYDNKFGTVGVSAKNTSGAGFVPTDALSPEADSPVFEITTMRKEGNYKDYRHPAQVAWTNKIAEDLARRDFTVNAMALGIEPGKSPLTLIDPFGGKKDLENKLIKAVGNPAQRFAEDALRLMRAVRLSAELDFQIEEKTFQAIRDNASSVTNIAWERIRDELFKILASDNAYEGIVNLKEAGLLRIILPELERCFGIAQEGPKHDRVYDIGQHSLLTLKHTASADPLVRFAALLHDTGKAETVKVGSDGNVTFYGHDVAGGKIVLRIARRFNLSNKQTDKLYRLVRWHLFTVDERQTDSAVRRFIKNVGLENIKDMVVLRIGDRLGGGTQKAVSWRMEKFEGRIKEVLKKPFSVSDLKVNGDDVMKTLNIKPGPKVGQILQKLFEEVLEDSSKNNREYLLGKVSNLSDLIS